MKYSDAKQILVGRFGWPDDFKEEQWAREHPRVWWEIENRFDPDRDDLRDPEPPQAEEKPFWHIW